MCPREHLPECDYMREHEGTECVCDEVDAGPCPDSGWYSPESNRAKN